VSRPIKRRNGQKTDRPTSSKEEKSRYGTKQFAEQTFNIQLGCEYGCKYCYACANLCGRFHMIADWTIPVLNNKAVNKNWKPSPRRVMFPSSHDITPRNLEVSIAALKKMLDADREVLIVTKPNFKCVKALCKELAPYKDKLVLRFTIGSCRTEILKFWEPNAPSFEVRLKSLRHAFEQGFKTSVLIEPLLDETPFGIIAEVDEFVTDTIWIGMMNEGRARLTLNGVTDPRMFELHDVMLSFHRAHWNEFRRMANELYRLLKEDSKIRWKGIDDVEY
jgi:DNA repair photolyase